MLEIRFHGLGGHGAVTAAKFMAEAAALSGFHSQAFGSYGALRRGGKVESYVRISAHPVRPHCKIYTPDCVVLMEESLIEDPSALRGLKPDGAILINSPKRPRAFQDGGRRYRIYTVDAYRIAADKDLMLPGGVPVINTIMVGALVGVLNRVDMEALRAAIKEGTPKAGKNVECAEMGYLWITREAGKGRTLRSSKVKGKKTCSPVFHSEEMTRCHRCQLCYIFCPNLAIRCEVSPFRLVLEESLCSGCGICVQECPRGAVSWGETSDV